MYSSGDDTSAVTLRARERLEGNNYVRMKMSAPFKTDSGEFNNKNILFNETFLAVGGDWGELAAGRMSNIFSGAGDFGLCPHINPSSTGTNFANASLTPVFSSGWNFNNTLTYNSPRVNGFHVALQYSNAKADDTVPRGDSDQVYNMVLTYMGGPWKFGLVTGYFDNSTQELNGVQPNPEKNVALIGSYWPGDGWSFHAAYQYVRDGKGLGGSYFNYYTPKANGGLGIARSSRGVDAHAVILAMGKRFGNQKISLALMGNRVEYQGDSVLPEGVRRVGYRVVPAGIYRYYFSKRTHLWAAASYSNGYGLYEGARNSAIDPVQAVNFGMGLSHWF